MTRAHLHGVTILADATMAMVTFTTRLAGIQRRLPIRTAEELLRADRALRAAVAPEACDAVCSVMVDAWESHIEQAWAALEARTAEVSE